MSFASLAATATKLIKKNGALTTLRRQNPSVLDEKTDKTTIVPPTTWQVYAVILPARSQDSPSLVMPTIRRALIAPTVPVDPVQNDELLWEGEWLKLESTPVPLRPNGTTTLLYDGVVVVSA